MLNQRTKIQYRITDTIISKSFNRSERIFTDGMSYYYKIRNQGISTAFETHAAALFDLNNFIIAISIENELKNENNILTN